MFLEKFIEKYFKTKKIHSFFNQEISFKRSIFGNQSICAFGLYFSGTYIEKIWLRIFKHLKRKKKFSPQNVLLLGQAAGSAFYSAQKVWPYIVLTGVDIDKTIIDLGKLLYTPDFFSHKSEHNSKKVEESKQPKTFVMDANKFLDINQEKFDLILIDLFSGPQPSELIVNDNFIKKIGLHLNNKGYFVLNIYKKNKEINKKWQKYFPDLLEKKILYNRFILSEYYERKINYPI